MRQQINQTEDNANLSYQELAFQYTAHSFTYKSNKILKQLSDRNPLFRYPYELIMNICKLLHFNQFELIFFSQILMSEQPCHQIEAQIFYRPSRKLQFIKQPKDRSLYLYLVVVGFAVKYYLNDNVSVYDLEIKRLIPQFNSIFQSWAKKYSNKVLKTNPKKLNTFYMELMKTEEQEDMNYKNYNQIIEELGYIGPAQMSQDQQLGQTVDMEKYQDYYEDSYNKIAKQ